MKKQLQCGLCLKEGKEQTISLALPLDLMMAMLTHWHYTHNDMLVPVFDQNTWRTGIVYPLDYTPTLSMAVGPTKHREESGHCAKCTYATKKLVPWPCESAQDTAKRAL